MEEALAAAGEQQRSLAAETAAFRRDAAAALARREAASAVLRRLEAEGAMVNASARALRDKQGGLQVRMLRECDRIGSIALLHGFIHLDIIHRRYYSQIVQTLHVVSWHRSSLAPR